MRFQIARDLYFCDFKNSSVFDISQHIAVKHSNLWVWGVFERVRYLTPCFEATPTFKSIVFIMNTQLCSAFAKYFWKAAPKAYFCHCWLRFKITLFFVTSLSCGLICCVSVLFFAMVSQGFYGFVVIFNVSLMLFGFVLLFTALSKGSHSFGWFLQAFVKASGKLSCFILLLFATLLQCHHQKHKAKLLLWVLGQTDSSS